MIILIFIFLYLNACPINVWQFIRKMGSILFLVYMFPSKSDQLFFDTDQYLPLYEEDLLHANKDIVISSSTLSKSSIMHYTELLRPSMERGVIITVLCLDPHQYIKEQQERQERYISIQKQSGIIVHIYSCINVRYCVIDQELVWYDDMNLLSNVKKDQVMLRYSDPHSASELLELSTLHEKE